MKVFPMVPKDTKNFLVSLALKPWEHEFPVGSLEKEYPKDRCISYYAVHSIHNGDQGSYCN